MGDKFENAQFQKDIQSGLLNPDVAYDSYMGFADIGLGFAGSLFPTSWIKFGGFFGAREASTFFQGAKYSPKVMQQMSKADDIFHAFPKSVDGFATKFGKVSTRIGGDGKTYQLLEMSGSYGGKTGTFEYIKDANGLINHRFFKVP
ncbi:MAG: hypothetical protein R2774_16245 [Saprospiraceae bacterium]